MNDLKFEAASNELLVEELLEELTSHEVEAIAGGARDGPVPMACFAKCQRKHKQSLRN